MTKLIFLGSGSAFTVGTDNFQSNMLIVSDSGRKLLVDAGSDLRFSLNAAGFSYRDITDVYISHLHADHAGGLEFLGFSTKFDPRCNSPNLYLSKELADELWTRTLSGGMRSIEGDITDLNTFFRVHKVERNSYFTWENIKFHLIKVIHVDNGYFVMPTYGLRFEVDGVKVFLSTDTQMRPECTKEHYEWADIIFEDCETSNFPSSIHAHYKELLVLPENIKKKMWLYHYQPGETPQSLEDGFCGFVKRGQVFDFKQLQQTLSSRSNCKQRA